MSHPKRVRRVLLIAALVLGILVIGPSLLGFGRVAFACRIWEKPARNENGSAASDAAIEQVTRRISNYTRTEDATYFTLPEWYVVYNADEYADFIAKNPPSRFPYFRAVGQFWQSWVHICEATRGRYPYNGGTQFMLVFVGANFTAETMIRGMYETTIGRLTEMVSSDAMTEEDAFARQVAREYGDFMHMTPWYEFPFGEKLRGLWAETGMWGPNPIRKWERKLALSVDYGVKAFYGRLVGRGAQAAYGGPDDTQIYAVVEGVSDELLAGDPAIQVIQPIDDRRDLITLTRFEVFTQVVPGLTQHGLRFVELAGNDEVFVTVFSPPGQTGSYSHAEYLFALPVLSQPGIARVGLKVRVADLHLFLKELDENGGRLEHIYDY
jgi:hypothetical protein